ncbi:multinuclear nonheme iron-dependent oxidase [Streptomyces erythrochromogenes]|uniref:multinuclear nonheme iron-dependent oxidase n=1 Tax=Streptomyces erythrochromogenes TaxID=285574 RepID=UPI003802DAE6
MAHLGVGIGWRPEIADAVDRLDGLDWVEVVAENICPGHLPEALQRLRERGTRIVPHGVSLGLGGADRPDPQKLAALGERAVALGAPLVTEHIAFVRTSSPVLEAGHLLPVPRTRDALDVLCENVRIAQDALPVPLALENIAALFSWPGEEMTEGRFLTELVERTGVRLLIDVANLHTNRVNRGEDPAAVLDAIPLEALAYVHVAGGVERDGVWHDTHAHPVPPVVLDLLAELRSRVEPAGVLLERDDDFPPEAELAHELATIREVVTAAARKPGSVPEPKNTAAVPHTGAGARAATEPATGPQPQPVPGAQPEAGPQAGLEPQAGLGPKAEAASKPGPDPEPHAEAGPQAEAAPGPGADPEPDAGAGPQAAPCGGGGGARTRVALGQAALLSALVAGTPVPEGFDRARIRVQVRALAAKRADVVAKVAPELPGILGGRGPYRKAFLTYAKGRPMTAGYRRDALDFAEHLLIQDLPADPAARRRLTAWWRERAGARPPRRIVRWARTLVGRAA